MRQAPIGTTLSTEPIKGTGIDLIIDRATPNGVAGYEWKPGTKM